MNTDQISDLQDHAWELQDQGKLDEKVLAVGKNNPRYTDVWNYSEIYPHMLKEITHFFSIYKDLEGKRVEIKGWHDAAHARDIVIECERRFKENAGRKDVAAAVPAAKLLKAAK